MVNELQELNECIILANKNNNKHFLAKNRDRTYIPELSIIREVIDDLEIVYFKDEITGWIEGLNSNKIGIINSALLVEDDENANNIIKSDSEIIYKILCSKKLDDALDILVNYKNGLQGHTFLSDSETLYSVELINQNQIKIQRKKFDKPIVRTNHGNSFKNVGYTSGYKYTSSVLRKKQILENIKDNSNYFDLLTNSKYKENSNYNVFRKTKEMFTTSQFFFNLDELELHFKPVEDKSKLSCIVQNIPSNYEPKIKIFVYNNKNEHVKNVKTVSLKEKQLLDSISILEKIESGATNLNNRKQEAIKTLKTLINGK
jgi:hypothetical protein